MSETLSPKKEFKNLKHVEGDLKIYKTMDYNRFSFSDFNRKADIRLKLMNNIKDNDLTQYNPILVAADGVVIDGQHRFLVCRELSLPIYYIIAQRANIDDAPSINQATKVWNVNDFINNYSTRGNEEYTKLLLLTEQFNIAISSLFRLGVSIGSENINETVRKGHFKFRSFETAERLLTDFQDLKEVYPEFSNTDKFFGAFTRLYMLPSYDHERMLKKLATSSSVVRRQGTTEAMAQELLKLYNYKQTHRTSFPIPKTALKKIAQADIALSFENTGQ